MPCRASASMLTIGSVPTDGSPLAVNRPAQTVTGPKLTVTAVSSTTQNVGLTEIHAQWSTG